MFSHFEFWKESFGWQEENDLNQKPTIVIVSHPVTDFKQNIR